MFHILLWLGRLMSSAICKEDPFIFFVRSYWFCGDVAGARLLPAIAGTARILVVRNLSMSPYIKIEKKVFFFLPWW